MTPDTRRHHAAIPDVMLPAGTTIGTKTQGLAAADQWAYIALLLSLV